MELNANSPKRHTISVCGVFGLKFGWMPAVIIVGAPFRNFAKLEVGSLVTPPTLCLLERVPLGQTAAVHLPIEDFKTPTVRQMERAIVQAAYHMGRHNELYVGCAGGFGRTGTIIAALAKLSGKRKPVEYVREKYHPAAVETAEQKALVNGWKPDLVFKVSFYYSYIQGRTRHFIDQHR